LISSNQDAGNAVSPVVKWARADYCLSVECCHQQFPLHKIYTSLHVPVCLSESAALVQVLESQLATSQQQSTCIHTDLKSEAAHVSAQLMATGQQLDRVEKAQKALAQQQQTRIEVRATWFCSPQL